MKTDPRNADARVGGPGVVCGKASVTARGANGSGWSTRPHSAGSPIDILLSRLEGVRKSGKGWQARCPAHGDRHASLSIGEAPTGAALVHCFAGCDTAAVLAAISLEAGDLFPPRLIDKPQSRAEAQQQLRERAVWGIGAAIAPLVDECTLVRVAASWVRSGKGLTDADLERLLVAEQRFDHALTVLKPKLRESWR